MMTSTLCIILRFDQNFIIMSNISIAEQHEIQANQNQDDTKSASECMHNVAELEYRDLNKRNKNIEET